MKIKLIMIETDTDDGNDFMLSAIRFGEKVVDIDMGFKTDEEREKAVEKFLNCFYAGKEEKE